MRMSWPNRITLGRILLTAPFVIAMLYLNQPRYAPWARYAALSIFLAIALSDALDGFLARRRNCVTALGTFLDPVADKLLITSACLLLAAGSTAIPQARLPNAVVVIIIGKDIYIVLGFLVIYFITSQTKIVPATVGKLSTTLQLSMVVAILVSPEAERLIPGFTRYFVRGLWWAAAGAALLTAIIYTRNGSRYVNEYEQNGKRQKQDPPAAK